MCPLCGSTVETVALSHDPTHDALLCSGCPWFTLVMVFK